MKIFSRLFCLLVILTCFLSQDAISATIKNIVSDMKPLEGYVVDVVGGQVILDLGSDAGVHKYDLFTIFHQGRKLTDPITGKVLGRIETRSGVLSVTRVERIFSYANAAGHGVKVNRGDKIVRFKEITAAAVDKTGRNDHFFSTLQQDLPALNWQEKKTSNTELVFIREGNFLKIKDNHGRVIRDYQIDQMVQPVAQPQVTAQSFAPVYAAGAATGAVTGGNVNSNGKIRYDLQTYGYNQGGSLPYSAIMGDFLMLKGTMHLAVIRDHEVMVYKVQDKGLQRVAGMKTPWTKLLSVCWWQPGSGATYIGMTGYDTDGQQVSSILLQYQNGSLAVVQKEIPYIINSSDVNGDGKPEIMLAQNFDQDVFFGRKTRQLILAGTTVKTVKYRDSLPPSYRVTGGTVFQQAAGTNRSAAYIVGNKLHIVEGGRQVYSSAKEMGGSLSTVRYVQDPGSINPLFSNANIEIRPLAVDVDNDGTREVLVPSADLSVFSTVGGANSIKKTWISVLKKTEAGTYMKGKIGGNYDQYIQGIGAANGSLYLLTVNPGGVFTEARGQSRLLVLPMAD